MMDFTIIYRVLWQPSVVFKKFVDRTRPEPFIFIAIVVPLSMLYTHRNDLHQLISHPELIATGLLKGFYSALKWPFLNGLIVYFFVKSVAKYKVQILPLASAFTLCLLPYYIALLIYVVSGYPGYLFGAGGLFSSLKETHPILFSMIATINIYFLWEVYLWYAALNQLINITKQQMIRLLVVLIVFPIVTLMLWFVSSVIIFNVFNPVS